MVLSLAIFLAGAVMAAGAGLWVLRAYRRAGAPAPSRLKALWVCAATALLGALIYLAIGRPGLPDAPFAARLEALQQRDPVSYSVEEALAVLAEAARHDPRDPLPHFYSGQLLLERGRAGEAARAFDAALRRDPANAEALLGLGRAIVRAEGRVTPEAIAIFQQAGELSDDPTPWLYQAMAAMEEGRGEDARRLWREALSRMAPDDPRRDMARRMSIEAGR